MILNTEGRAECQVIIGPMNSLRRMLDILALILVTTITGFSISLILSVIYRKLIHQTPLVTWGLTAVVLFVAVLMHAHR